MLKTEDKQIPDEQLKIFLAELMGEEEADGYIKHEKAKERTLVTVDVPTEVENAKDKVEAMAEKVIKKTKIAKPKVKLPVEKDKRIIAKLGEEKLNDLSQLEFSDANKDHTSLKEHLLDRLAHAPKKVANRITYFVEYVTGVSDNLPTVLTIAVKTLLKDGHISANNKMNNRGNLYQKLIDYPYSPASASAMGANTVKAMQVLKMVIPNENDELILNPQSRILAKIRDKMNL